MSSKTHIDVIASGTTEELFRKGLANDRNMLSASALVSPAHYELVVKAQEDFVKAGATYLVSNNYYVTPGIGFTTEEIRDLTRLAARLATDARSRAGKDESTVKVCGSLPPLMPSFRSDRMVDRAEGLETYKLIGDALLPFVDMFVAETMSSLEEAKMAYEAVDSLHKPILVSFALNSTGQLRSGEPVIESIKSLVEFCTHRAEETSEGEFKLAGILFNCSQPEDISQALKTIHDTEGLVDELKGKGIRLGAYGDRIAKTSKAGQMESKLMTEEMRGVLDMEVYSNFTGRWVEYGAEIVGGCCGITSDYLEAAVEKIKSASGMP